MIILGFTGGFNSPHRNELNISHLQYHDSAAALIADGKVISAVEEERLNRIKHTNKFPYNAIKFVLADRGIELKDVDKICYYFEEDFMNRFLKESLPGGNVKDLTVRHLIRQKFRRLFRADIDSEKISFVNHHIAHAASAYYLSGFDNALIFTIDGQGDDISGSILTGNGTGLTMIKSFSVEQSLGWFYVGVINFLGYDVFDEYKVMGLAPYGDPGKYRDLFKKFYRLLPGGDYAITKNHLRFLYRSGKPREKGEPFTQMHKDIAAALQESLEEIVMHVLKYYREKYRHNALCLSGGVAHNCTMNGKIMYSSLFDKIFVYPAAHDAGCAVGAPLYLNYKLDNSVRFSPLEHLYSGSGIGNNRATAEHLSSWSDFISFKKSGNIARDAAELLAKGRVIGWARGRSEFGPRALGNRSILADPRPPENKDIINEMVKKRESYRPFAPSILEEYAHRYYEISDKKSNFPYMIFVLKVKEEVQKKLGAVTHVDGTARIQTVSKKTNPQYWQLIDEFRKITGIPIVLNTSFNNNAEPIVDSLYDAVVCFLTTKLHELVVGDYLVTKKEISRSKYLQLKIQLPAHIMLNSNNGHYWISNTYKKNYRVDISSIVFFILNSIDKGQNKTLDELILEQDIDGDDMKQDIIDEIIKLWGNRVVKIYP